MHAVRAAPDVNNPPVFASASTMMREVNEDETNNAGDPVTANDADGDSLTYTHQRRRRHGRVRQ